MQKMLTSFEEAIDTLNDLAAAGFSVNIQRCSQVGPEGQQLARSQADWIVEVEGISPAARSRIAGAINADAGSLIGAAEWAAAVIKEYT